MTDSERRPSGFPTRHHDSLTPRVREHSDAILPASLPCIVVPRHVHGCSSRLANYRTDSMYMTDDPDYDGPVCDGCGNTEYECICESRDGFRAPHFLELVAMGRQPVNASYGYVYVSVTCRDFTISRILEPWLPTREEIMRSTGRVIFGDIFQDGGP